jgi:plastocyanin
LSSESFSALPQRGVFLSTNALSVTPTFTREPVQTAAGAGQDRTITDMVMDPNNPNKILVYVFGTATAGDGGLWMSTAGDPWAGTATWTQNATITRQGFGKFAAVSVGSPGVTTFMLAQDETVVCGAATSAGTVKTSPDGATWTGVPAANGFCSGQCFYDMVPAFHPDSAATIFIGGSSNSTTGTCSSRILLRSTNSGASFSASDALLHADSHAIAFAPGNHNVVYFGNDGGIFKSVDAGVTWSSVNTTGFNATQFIGLSLHPVDPNFAIGGTQDNGTEFMKPDGTWTRADFGDGGYSAIDQGSTDTTNVTMYHTYFNARNSQILVARVTNVASATEGAWSLFGCPAVPAQITGNGITCTDFVLFYAPIALGPGSPNTLYFGTDHLYRSPDRGATMTPVSQPNFGADAGGNNFRVSAIGIASTNDNVRLIGLTNGKAFATTTGANPLTDVTGPWAARFIARAVIDPTNASTAYITLDGYGIPAHVWKTTNLAGGSGTWAAASTGLPDVPVNAFAVDPLNPSYLYAGTDIGVFNSIDGGTTWNAYGSGLPRVAVFDLSVHKISHKVRIATHGRGAWEIAAAANFANTLGLSANPPSPALGATVTLTATINKGTGVPVPAGTVTFSEGVTNLGSGNVNGSGVATLAISTLPAGIHQITATYSGDTLYAGSTSGTVQINVGGAGTTLGLSASPGNVNVGTQVTFTATINTGGNVTVPTGTVSFIENANVLGTSALAGSAVATFQTSSLTVGSHSITASYSGDAVYSSSISAPTTVTVVNPTPPDYSVNIPNGSATIAAGQSANYTISITPQGGFTGTVNFACTGLPGASSCGFNPTTVTPNGSPASTTLTISTTARSVASARPFNGNTLAAVLSFGLIGIVFLSRASRRKRSARAALMLLGTILTALAIISCGGGGTPPPPVTGTPAGSFSVTVTATSGATTHSSTITLNVQ